MSDKGSGTVFGGNGLMTAGVVLATLVAVGGYLSLRQDGLVSQEDVTALVNPVDTTTLDAAEAVPDAIETPPAQVTETAPAPEETVVSEEETVSEADSGSEAAASDDPQPDAVVAIAPKIDEVRVDENGILVVAGRADPGSRVDVLVDGKLVTSANADSTGAFAALGSVSANDTARTLTLQSGEGAEAIASDEEIILAPMKKPDSGSAENTELAAQNDAQETPETAAEEQIAVSEDTETEGQSTPSQLTPSGSEPADEASQADEQIDEAGQETSEIAVLRSDTTGVSLVQQAPATSVVLDTIGYSDEGDVQLGGRAGVEAVEIRAYLNNRAVARLSVEAGGNWRGEVPDVDAGIYTLRVDALTADGTVASRIETPFKREAPAALAAATDSADGPVRAITVQAGDTLWAIARDRYGEGLLYVQVFEANRTSIRDPDLIYPGQVFDLPGE